jgi:hypothetical protein
MEEEGDGQRLSRKWEGGATSPPPPPASQVCVGLGASSVLGSALLRDPTALSLHSDPVHTSVLNLTPSAPPSSLRSWVANCIGRDNRKYFVLLLMNASGGLGVFLVWMLPEFVQAMTSAG